MYIITKTPDYIERSTIVTKSSTETSFKITYSIPFYHMYCCIWDATLCEKLVRGKKMHTRKMQPRICSKGNQG